MMKPWSVGFSRAPFILRALACVLLLLLPLVFPHSPWKPEETRVVGILLKYLNHEAAPGTFIPSANRIFWWVNLRWIEWTHSQSQLEVVARTVSIIALVLGAGALYGWAHAMHRRYPNMVPADICSGAPLLVASSLGMMIRGYQATPESVWFVGVAFAVWAGTETQRLRRYGVFGFSVLWLWFCGDELGGLLSVVCAGVIPWLFRWRAGERTRPDYIEGGLVFAGMVSLLALSRAAWIDATTWQMSIIYLREIGRVLIWYALPAWPLALAVWWRGSHLPERIRIEWARWRWEPLAQLVVTLLIGVKVGSIRWQESHVLMYLPFLVAMALPALYLVDVRSWFNAVLWFTRSVLILLLVAVWGAVSALHSHVPWFVYQRLEAYQPGFNPTAIKTSAWILSLVLTGYALRYLLVPCKTLRDSLWRWTLGFGCTTCVIRLMLVPYIDYGRNYRSAMERLNTAIPASEQCVELMPSVGAPQRAMWRYYTGRSTKAKDCEWRVFQGSPAIERADVEWLRKNDKGHTWKKIIQTSRPGDRYETFFLMHRTISLP